MRARRTGRRSPASPAAEQPPEEAADPHEPSGRVLDANQVVAYNFRAARELRGWTQDEAARQLEPYLGQVLPKASISAIERSLESDRRRQFDAQELVAFAMAFDLPIVWFLLPPPGSAHVRLAGTGREMTFLVRLLVGRQGQLQHIRQRLDEIREADDPDRRAAALSEAAGFPDELSWDHFQRTREEALLGLVEQESGTIERLLGELRGVLDKFEDFSLKSHLATHPREVYRDISHSILGERIFHRVLTQEKHGEATRFPLVRTLLVSSQRAMEDAIDLDDPELVERLAAVYDRLEERLQKEGTPKRQERRSQ